MSDDKQLGDRLRAGRKPIPAAVRFRANVRREPKSRCWVWLGAPCRRGTTAPGYIKVDGRPIGARRYAWQIARGPIPPRLLVMSRCATPLCVNPAHLFLGSHQDVHERETVRRAARPTRSTGHGRAAHG